MKKCLAIALAACAGFCLCAADPGHWNGGRTVPVHRLAPLDFDGEKVSPSASLPSPISQDKTCGQCQPLVYLVLLSPSGTGKPGIAERPGIVQRTRLVV